MKKIIISLLVFTIISITSCSVFNALHSTTEIKPNDSFVLGNNEHGKFKLQLQNISNHSVEVYHAPINGGKHSTQTILPNQSIKVLVDPNTAIIIVNNFNDSASVKLVVTGDTGLSMGYKN